MVARQSLGEHKPAVTTWQPNQPCRCSSSTTYRVPILQEFPTIPLLVQKERQVFCLLCCKGIITKLILMHCKRGQDVLPGISPRTQVRVQPVGTRNPEGHFQGCCLDLRWAHSRQMSWVAMTWVMHNKSVSQRVYHLNQSIFNTASERVYSECSRLKGLFVFFIKWVNLSPPERLLSCRVIKLSDFQVNAQWTKGCSTFTYLNSARSINTQAVETIFTIHN